MSQFAFQGGEEISGSDRTYQVENHIAKGGFGSVYKAKQIDATPPLPVAIKVLDNANYDSQNLKYIEQEAKIMKELSHPNIVKILDTFDIEDHKFTVIVMEYARGANLENVIWIQGPMDEYEARDYFVQLVDAVEHCHKHGVRHRDIKPRNIVVDINKGAIKLCDFGVSAKVDKEVAISPKLLSPVGTRAYRAPEVDQKDDKGYSGALADVFSCGVTLYAMLKGEPPALRSDINIQTLNVSRPAKELLRLMLARVKDRITLQNVKCHPWCKGQMVQGSIKMTKCEEA